MPSQSPAELITAAIAAWNAGDLDRIMADFADDAVLTRLPLAPGGGAHVGTEAIRAWIAPLLPGFHADVQVLRADGNVVTVVETVAYDSLRARGVDFDPRHLPDAHMGRQGHLHDRRPDARDGRAARPGAGVVTRSP
jgi:hypothetical protein